MGWWGGRGGTLDCIIPDHNFSASSRGPFIVDPIQKMWPSLGVSLLFIFKSILNYYKEDPLPALVLEMKLWGAAVTLSQSES